MLAQTILNEISSQPHNFLTSVKPTFFSQTKHTPFLHPFLHFPSSFDRYQNPWKKMEKQDTDRRMLAPKTSMDSTLKKLHQEPISHFPSSNTKHKVRIATTTDPDVQNVQTQLKKSSSRRGSKNKESPKGSQKEHEVVKFQNPLKEEKEKKERLSSGAIVKIKEMKISEEITEHDLTKQREVALISGPNVGRRRSLCGSHQVELSDFLTGASARIVSVDMPPFMQIHAVGCARKARDSLENFSSKALALTLKKEFDVVYGPAWHCIVGSSFGSFVTHSVGGFLYFSLDQKFYVLLFKTSVQKAD